VLAQGIAAIPRPSRSCTYGKKATIITTNLEYEDWYGFLGQKEMVGALLDRLRHRCHTIRIEGQSLREPQS
jgi:DNA replication protein DnaC